MAAISNPLMGWILPPFLKTFYATFDELFMTFTDQFNQEFRRIGSGIRGNPT